MTTKQTIVTTNESPLFQVSASFVQHSLPGLSAGKYTVTAQQKIDDDEGASVTNGALPVVSHSFGVEGDKYTLPTRFIHSIYPAAGAQGVFSTALPQIVLKNAVKLPWIRTPYYHHEPQIHTHAYPKTNPTGKYDDDKASWLFIMVLSASDFDGTMPRQMVKKGTVADLIPDTMTVRSLGKAAPGKMPATKGYSSFSYVFESGETQPAGTELDPGVGYDGTDPISFIDIPVGLFAKLAPTIQDLRMMSHVRSVRMDNKALADSDVIDPEGEYAVMMANRLPQSLPTSELDNPTPGENPKGANAAMVVSLEYLECALRGYADASYFKSTIQTNPKGFVRLVVLTKWEFTSYQDTSFEFVTLLEHLNERVPDEDDPESTPLDDPLMRLPNPPSYSQPTPAENTVQTMLSLGYVPMNHLTRVPDVTANGAEPIQTVSWYRGPLAPFVVPADADGPLGGGVQNSTVAHMVYSADALLKFDPDVGLYDTSYAAAWQLGRLMALNDQSFSTAYYQWQRSRVYSLRAAYEMDSVTQPFAPQREVSFALLELTKTRSGLPTDTLLQSAVSSLVMAAQTGGDNE